MFVASFPRRQQYRRLRQAAAATATGLTAGALALQAVGAGALRGAGLLLLTALGLGLYTRHWLALAGRSRVGARSED